MKYFIRFEIFECCSNSIATLQRFKVEMSNLNLLKSRFNYRFFEVLLEFFRVFYFVVKFMSVFNIAFLSFIDC